MKGFEEENLVERRWAVIGEESQMGDQLFV